MLSRAEWLGEEGVAVVSGGSVYFPIQNLRLRPERTLGTPELIFLPTQALFPLDA